MNWHNLKSIPEHEQSTVQRPEARLKLPATQARKRRTNESFYDQKGTTESFNFKDSTLIKGITLSLVNNPRERAWAVVFILSITGVCQLARPSG